MLSPADVLRAIRGFLGRLAGRRGSAGSVCPCGYPMDRVEGHDRGWCQRCGFLPDTPAAGWPTWCPDCGFMLGKPEDSLLSCPHCHWYERWPPKPPTRGKKKWRPAGER